MNTPATSAWPALPLDGWQATYETLHMCLQIVGKTRLALAPMQNHWWNVALYVTQRGLTTGAIPSDYGAFAVDVDFRTHEVVIETSTPAVQRLGLTARPVADFYRDYTAALRSLAIDARLMARPVEVVTAIPFADDRVHASYDADAARRWWRITLQTQRVLQRFAARFVGKASPVHFFWGSFDLAHTRFSGRPAPRHPGGAPNCPDYVMVEAYSRECASWGFWPGGGALAEPAFYAYAYPEPRGFAQQSVLPRSAYYSAELREFVLPYEAMRLSGRPDDTLLEFLQSTYDAAAGLARWDRALLDRPTIEWSGLRA